MAKIRLSIFSRLVIGYTALLLPVCMLLSVILWQLNNLQQTTFSAATDDSAILRATDHLLEILYSQAGFERKFQISADPEFRQRFEELAGTFSKNLAELDRAVTGPVQHQAIREASSAFTEYLEIARHRKKLGAGKKLPPEAPVDAQAKTRLVEKISGALATLTRETTEARIHKIRESNRLSARLYQLTVVVTSLIVVLGLTTSFFTTRAINRPIVLLRNKTRELAAGNYERIGETESLIEIAELTRDFNEMGDRLKELDQMKADFVSHISHELRTPLMAIREVSSMLLEGLYQNNPEKQHELYEISFQECERLIASVNKILDISRMEAGMVEYHFVEGDFTALVNHCTNRLAPLAKRKRIQFQVQIDEGLPPVRMDKNFLGQVLGNLIGNALKFTPVGGRISIRAGVESIGKKAAMIRTSVADTGCGIPPQDLDRIFHRFSTGRNNSGMSQGTGLGLSIAKRIILDHGGEIWAENLPEAGCVFSFTLPVSSQ